MGRWADIETAVRSTVGATTSADARLWALDAARRLNARAEYLTAPVAIASTSAGTSEYSLGDTMIDLAAVRVGTAVYTRITPNEMWDLEAGTASWTGTAQFYAPDWSSTGGAKIQLYPTPDEAGLAIEGREVIRLPAPADWAADDPPIPEDFDSAIVHGAVAIGLQRKDERLDDATWHEQRFDSEISELKRRRHSRVGSGAVRIRVAGRDFR